LLLVKRAPGKVLVGTRPAGKQDAGKIDGFGGHCRPDDFPDPLRAALREGEEELTLLSGTFPIQLSRGWFTQIGPAFGLECLDVRNRERSTLFGLSVPEGVDEVLCSDDTDSGEVNKLETRIVTWDDLLSMYRDSPVQFADGLGRILKRALDDASFDRQIREFIG
jgi:8-oxo-dGTP pyrophosphatase MutT (NUDIX family)